MIHTRMIAAILVAGAVLLPHGSAFARGGWCAEYNFGEGGATNCGFPSYEQCRAAVSGVGGACRPG